jgi:hypothetical protein
MIKFYIGQPIPNLPIVELIRPNLKASGLERWTERYVQLSMPIVELVQSPEEADALLIPHNYNYLKENSSYIQSFVDLSNKTGKKIIVFFPGDSDEEVPIPNSVIFRNSQYKSKLKPNEVILPGYVADLGKGIELKPRHKSVGDPRPVIGFCGWGKFKNFIEETKFVIKTIRQWPRMVRMQGLWWRQTILTRLSKSFRIKTNFIIRGSYSGNEKTIELDPEQAKREYIQNILTSDFTLCVKGDGNFSTRFFEVLSLGRIPLLFDTESVLPLEDIIDYSRIICRVDYKKYPKMGKIVSDFYASLSESQFMEMQTQAREIFEKYLRLDKYFEFVFGVGYVDKFLK